MINLPKRSFAKQNNSYLGYETVQVTFMINLFDYEV